MVDKEVWTGYSTGNINCLKIKSSIEFESCLCFEFISGVVTAMCQVNDSVWMGDTLGKIYVLRVSDYSKAIERDLESQVGYCGAVVSVRVIDPVVAVAVTSGRLFLCDADSAELLSELGKSTLIHCLCSRQVDDGASELWAGEKAGQMTIFTIKDGTVISQELINHYEPIIDAVEVLLVDAHVSNETIFSYVYPGSVVYGWDCEKREMISRLDVGKLLPVRDFMEDELNSKPLQVTVLRSTHSEVYIGTNRGFIFVADIKGLRPITSFKPFTEDVRCFCIFRQMQTFSTMLNLSSYMNQLGASEDSESRGSTTSAEGNDLLKVTEVNEEPAEDKKVSNRLSSCERSESEFFSVENSRMNARDSANTQLLVGIGKGFCNILQRNSHNSSVSKQKRRAFAMLWHVKDSWG